jgi:LysR family transcriptional regulator for metE and metH
LSPVLARVERELHRAGERKRTVLRVVVECFTAYQWLPPVVAELARVAPHVDVRVALEATREPVAALLRGAIDVAIVSSPVHERTLVVTPLFDDEWVVVVPPRHRLASRPWVTAKQLGEESVFAHDSPRSDVERLRELVSAEHAPMPRVTTVPLTELVVAFVKAGAGVGLVSRWVAAPYAASGEVACKRFTRAGVPERWVAVARRDSTGSGDVARFVELVRSLASPAVGKQTSRRARGPTRRT